jgi:hypothetical protein
MPVRPTSLTLVALLLTGAIRLADGRIALFYARKNSLDDCRPLLRLSDDEAQTWSEPKVCIEDEVGYYVLNNAVLDKLT